MKDTRSVLLCTVMPFPRVPRRYVLLFLLLTLAYQSRTIFTDKVDIPGNLAFVAYPWQALNRPAVRANTGIVFTQLVPWTRVARDELLRGRMPLWNRTSASGTPLLANQQTALFHPFTLLGLWLPIGKAFTLSASLRLFTLLFFSFVLFRLWGAGEAAALFGAVAYTFCAFHIIWLLFPLGLSSMMLPVVLVGIEITSRDASIRAHAFLVAALSLAILGGHPESALWVWVVAAAYALYLRKGLLRCASAFVAAMMLTAFFWYPTMTLLERTARFQGSSTEAANPADHGLKSDWLLPLISPNAFGTPQKGNYTAPPFSRGVVLNDYGEVASGYAGLATLGLAASSIVFVRRKPVGFLLALLLFSFCTFWEVPLWRDLIHHLPLLGVSLHQRLRLFWVLAVAGLAVLAIDEQKPRPAVAGISVVIVLLAMVSTPANFIVPALCAIAVIVALSLKRPVLASLAVLIELVFITWNYNPPARPADLFPETEAIRRLRAVPQPARMAAWGWSFIPDTPGYYGLEDVKTTDPISDAHYQRFFHGYLRTEGGDSVIGETTYPFFDFLNIEHVYAPPGAVLSDPDLECVYRGRDGAIYRNRAALPRYFAVPRFTIEPSFDMTVGLSKQISDFRQRAIVDHIPAKIAREAPALKNGIASAATVRVVQYDGQHTLLDVDSAGWTLLVSSDVNWPGWRAYVNGRRLPPVTVNGAFLGCFVPGGHSRVEFLYRPDAYVNGLRAGGAGLLILLGSYAAIVSRARRRSSTGRARNRAPSPSPGDAAS